MISNFWCYYYWSEKLSQEIIGSYLNHSISFNKDSLILGFTSKNQQKFLEFKFVDGELVILNDFNGIGKSSKNKQNAIVQFKEISNAQVVNIYWDLFDRLITINFSNQFSLIVKGFGRYSNVLLFDPLSDLPESIFRLNLKNDWEFKRPKLQPRLVWNNNGRHWQLNGLELNEDYLFKNYKSIPHEEVALVSELLSKEIHNIDQFDFFNELSIQLINGKFGVKLEGSNFQSWENNINDGFKRYLKQFFFEIKSNQLNQRLEKEIKQIRSHIKGLESRLIEIQNRRSFKEIGDLILTNSHSIKQGVTEALLFDYYTNHRIRVKLNGDLSAAENAEKFYRKAKNESLELETLKNNLENSKYIESEKSRLFNEVNTASETKTLARIENELKSLLNPKKTKSKQSISLPYKVYEYDSFEIWVGKNSKSNDELLRVSKKQDLWLHAYGVSGSHVIIRKKLKNYPTMVIQFAAEIAAFHSKGKHQTIQTVMYTERKFVSKVKGASSGQVSVLQFQTIDVSPKGH